MPILRTGSRTNSFRKTHGHNTFSTIFHCLYRLVEIVPHIRHTIALPSDHHIAYWNASLYSTVFHGVWYSFHALEATQSGVCTCLYTMLFMGRCSIIETKLSYFAPNIYAFWNRSWIVIYFGVHMGLWRRLIEDYALRSYLTLGL